jgi:DNA-binding transcriptional regulator GbsR (MarR family)
MLYLEQRPLSAADIGERLSLSTGAMSMLLTELQEWSVVRKTWVPGERRDYYEAETSIWKMVSRVLRERELIWIRDAADHFAAADAALDKLAATSGRGKTAEDAARVAGIAAKVAGLSQLSTVGAALIENILSGESVDALPIKTVGELAKAVKPPT